MAASDYVGLVGDRVTGTEVRDVYNKEFAEVETKQFPKPKAQVNGSHYSQAIEPIEYIEANNIPFHEGNVIKYISRWKKKNGIEDLKKCRWYIDRLIELENKKEFKND